MAQCRACNKEIYFLKTAKGKFIPVNAETLNDSELNDCRDGLKRLFVPGRHISHFADCPGANAFRKELK